MQAVENVERMLQCERIAVVECVSWVSASSAWVFGCICDDQRDRPATEAGTDDHDGRLHGGLQSSISWF